MSKLERQKCTASSINDLLRKSPWQGVEEQDEEQRCDEEDQGQDDVFLVAFPHQVEETLKRVDKPGKGSVRSAGGGREERTVRTSCSYISALL